MRAVYRHEISSLFTNLTGYVFAAFLLLFAGIYTMAINIQSAAASFEYVLKNMSFTFLIIVPVLTMRSVAEEKRQRTDTLLYSLPISMTEVAVGKYAALLTVFLVPVLIISLYPLVLSAYGNMYLPAAYGAILGFFFLGAALIAVGMFVSSASENQTVAAVITFVLLLVNYFLTSLSGFVSSTAFASLVAFSLLAFLLSLLVRALTKNTFTAMLTLVLLLAALLLCYVFLEDSFAGLFPAFLEAISLFDRFEGITEGILDLRVLVFYLSVAGVFLYLTVQSLEKRRWSE
ncbi:MAG: ABC transporter permease subunit [Oscillospiraceae bacterium]|nr:ABC transporter permease subunit [Oscillospiraceae bacterium]